MTHQDFLSLYINFNMNNENEWLLEEEKTDELQPKVPKKGRKVLGVILQNHVLAFRVILQKKKNWGESRGADLLFTVTVT